MALLFMDGFGGQDYAFKWDLSSSSYTTSSASPRTPGGYRGAFANGGTLFKTIPTSSKVITGAGFTVANNIFWISFYGDAGATQHITITRNTSTGFIEIRRGSSGGVLLATGTTPIFINQWNYIEVSCTVSDTVGEVHVRLNGLPTDEVSYVGDTKNAGTATNIDRVSYYAGSGPAGSAADVYILNDSGTANNNFLGDVVVRTLSPAGNGAYSQLTGSDGNQIDNYLLVDEHPYSGVDYAGSSVAGAKDTYAIADLPAGVTSVYGLQVNGMMAKSDASLGQARYVLRSGGTDYPGVTRALTTTFTGYYELHETDPSTGLSWTPSGVNSVEPGMEVV